MPGVVATHIAEQQKRLADEAAALFEKGRAETHKRLEHDYGKRWITSVVGADLGENEPWTINDARDTVQRIAISESDWISRARNYPNLPYRDDNYRRGARQAVMDFSRERNHDLLAQARAELGRTKHKTQTKERSVGMEMSL
jgi:hypothetical protein